MSVAQFWHPFALEPFLNALFIGLSIGSVWLLAALGLAVIYGTMGVINMAHGEFIMLGAYCDVCAVDLSRRSSVALFAGSFRNRRGDWLGDGADSDTLPVPPPS